MCGEVCVCVGREGGRKEGRKEGGRRGGGEGVGVVVVRTVCMTNKSFLASQPMHLIVGATSLWT